MMTYRTPIQELPKFRLARILTGFCALSLLLAVPTVQAAEVTPAFTNSIGMKFVWIPAGKFLFGGRDIQNPNLFPKPKGFEVTIDRAFYLGAYEVTQAEYKKVMDAKPAANRDPKAPVEQVSWDEAMAFCQRLTALPAEKAAGRVYSLPTEREWQYAARAGSDRLFTDGSDDETKIAEFAVCRDTYAGVRPLHPVATGTKKPNAWGLYDVLGNVWEWVLDAQPADRIWLMNAISTNIVYDQGESRVIVGGGWHNDFRMCNLASRWRGYPTRQADDIGFRVRCLLGEIEMKAK